MSILAIIPARGNSKRIPNKNIKLLGNKPLIAYSIQYALSESSVDRVIVSTDSREILALSKVYGAETPFLRPIEISTDQATDTSCVLHALKYMKEVGYEPEFIVYLRPTQPFRDSGDIGTAVKLLKENIDLDGIRTVRDVPYPPFWMKKIDTDNLIHPFLNEVKEYQYSRSQDLPSVYFCDGCIDVYRVKTLLSHGQMNIGKIAAMYKKNQPYVDIDTLKDWDFAEYLIKISNSNV